MYDVITLEINNGNDLVNELTICYYIMMFFLVTYPSDNAKDCNSDCPSTYDTDTDSNNWNKNVIVISMR